jgi:hypothetical protein
MMLGCLSLRGPLRPPLVALHLFVGYWSTARVGYDFRMEIGCDDNEDAGREAFSAPGRPI